MKKSQLHLLKLAAKFQYKYAQDLKSIIQNAASYGESSANGIMNFPAQLKEDQANLALIVTITSNWAGGITVEVSHPIVDPPNYASNYTKLPEQIKKYLEKYAKDLNLSEGQTTIQYSGDSPSSGIAQK